MPELYDCQLLQDLRAFATDCPVMVQNGKPYWAQELYTDALNIASSLSAEGFTPGARVLMLMRPDVSFSTVVYALGMLGAVVALVDPEMGKEHFEAKVRQFEPQWVFADRALLLLAEHPVLRFAYLHFSKAPFYLQIPKSCRIVATGSRWLPVWRKTLSLQALKRHDAKDVSWILDEDRPFLITYTSGTLDAPKGVVHSFRSLHESIARIRDIPGFNGTIGAYLPHFLLIGISTGNSVCMFDKHLNAKARLKLIADNRIAILFGPPSDFAATIEYCLEQDKIFPDCLKLILLGSAPVYPAFLRKLRSAVHPDTHIFCTYGMTENLLVAIASDSEKCAFTGIGDYLGKPVSGLSVYIADDGEICIQSPQLFQRYLHDKDRITPHPTGDLGYLEQSGALVLVSRKKDMIIRRDTNIYPALYEKTILSIPGVKDCAMIGIYNPEKHDEEIWLCVEGEGLDIPAIRKALRSGPFALDKEAQPDHIVVALVPRSGRQNKIDRIALKRSLAS